jgi:hypothetical protein
MHAFSRSVGIEVLESLQEQSVELKARYDSQFAGANMPQFEVYLGDILAAA